MIAGGASRAPAAGTYKVELDNTFSLVPGAQFKVAGVPAGTISTIGFIVGGLDHYGAANATLGPPGCKLVRLEVAGQDLVIRLKPG